MIQRVTQFFVWALLAACAVALLLSLLHIGDLGYRAFLHPSMDATRPLVEAILDGFVLIELLRSFADYIATQRLHLSLLLETAVVFVLREMASGLYAGHLQLQSMIGYSIIIPVLILSRKFAGREEHLES